MPFRTKPVAPARSMPASVSECFAFLARQLVDVSGHRCLADATLKLVTVPVVMKCACRFDGQLGADHLAGHISVCPQCRRVSEAKTSLDLVGMSFADNKPFAPA
jgi:hypothetical protein